MLYLHDILGCHPAYNCIQQSSTPVLLGGHLIQLQQTKSEVRLTVGVWQIMFCNHSELY